MRTILFPIVNIKQIPPILLILALFISCEVKIPDPVIPDQKEYSIGDLYHVGEVKGIVYQVDSSRKHGHIVSINSIISTKYPWTKVNEITGAIDEFNGIVNFYRVMMMNHWEVNYPAFYYWDQSGWYIPAINELKEIANNIEIINTIIEKNGGEIIEKIIISSTELSNNQVYSIQFGDNFSKVDYLPVLKRKESSEYFTRGVRKF